jgi:two-component system nitrogen regulation sensor histidine kinase GlnL
MNQDLSAPFIAHQSSFAGLDLLTTATVVVDSNLRVRFVNTAAESLFGTSLKSVYLQSLVHLIPGVDPLVETTLLAMESDMGFIEHEWEIPQKNSTEPLVVSCTGTPIHLPLEGFLLEFRPISQRMKIAREEKLIENQKTNRELMRNLAHEVRNPLGGIRGAAQLLEEELEREDLKEYTQVIRSESARLENLMDRMLSPHQGGQHLVTVNIHEVLERVRSVILAEYPQGITMVRDYDLSLPEMTADREQLIQAILNITRNAAQAMQGVGQIRLETRVMRQITLARQRFRLGIQIKIVDNGPGIPKALQGRIFQPLVSGREGGSGLGLMLAQNLISQHHGLVEFESSPGSTCFSILLPLTHQPEKTSLLKVENK